MYRFWTGKLSTTILFVWEYTFRSTIAYHFENKMKNLIKKLYLKMSEIYFIFVDIIIISIVVI